MPLLTLPARTISTMSMVSSSVIRWPSMKRGLSPMRSMTAPICGPPPWTTTGLIPRYLRKTTSSANSCLSSGLTMAWPPYLMTTVVPANLRMYGSVSKRMLIFSICFFTVAPPAAPRGDRNTSTRRAVRQVVGRRSYFSRAATASQLTFFMNDST